MKFVKGVSSFEVFNLSKNYFDIHKRTKRIHYTDLKNTWNGEI